MAKFVYKSMDELMDDIVEQLKSGELKLVSECIAPRCMLCDNPTVDDESVFCFMHQPKEK